jgi:hypothetical protein
MPDCSFDSRSRRKAVQLGRYGMTTTRKRLSNEARESRPAFDERVSEAAKDLEDRAGRLPLDLEREALLRRARRMEIAKHINEWLSSPGLQPPK